MRSRASLSSVLLFVFLLGAGGALSAAARCEKTDTILGCWNNAASRDLAENQQEELNAKPTGVDTGDTTLSSNTKNFLPLLALSGLLGKAQKGADENTYVLDLNFLIPGLALDKNAQLQAVVNGQPKVSQALTDQLGESTRDATVQKLQDELGELDDYAIAFTYNWTDARHGRGFNQYRRRFAALVQAAAPVDDVTALASLGEAVRKIQNDFPDPFDVTFEEIGRKEGADTMALLMRRTEEALAAEAGRLEGRTAALAASGLNHFADLLDNQPQLHLSAQKRFRDAVVGADETSGKLTYEWSMASFNNAMSKDCHARLDTPDPSSIDRATLKRCLSQYQDFVDANLSTLKTGTRFSLAAEYLDIPKETINRPADGVDGVTLAGAKKLIVSAGYTRLFPAGQGVQPMRLDLVAKYEDVSDDPSRQDRGVATLTVTRQFGNMAIPFGVVYATRGELLGQVDKRLSAHLGLKLNLFGAVAPPPSP